MIDRLSDNIVRQTEENQTVKQTEAPPVRESAGPVNGLVVIM